MRFYRISPQKTNLVANLIRGRKVEDAVKILTFTKKRSARVLLKLLKSALANAEMKNVEDTELLEINSVNVSHGPFRRKYQPRARGKADVQRRPTSHITIVVREDLEAKKEAEAKKAAREAKRAKKIAARKASVKKEKPAKSEKTGAKTKPAKETAEKVKTPSKKAKGKSVAKSKTKEEPKARAKKKTATSPAKRPGKDKE